MQSEPDSEILDPDRAFVQNDPPVKFDHGVFKNGIDMVGSQDFPPDSVAAANAAVGVSQAPQVL